MNLENRITLLEAKIASHEKIINQLVCEKLFLRAFAQAIIEQPCLDLPQLRDWYVHLWEQALQQLPPEYQASGILKELLADIEAAVTRRAKP